MFRSDTEIEELLNHSNNKAIVKIIGQGQDDRKSRAPNGIRETLSVETKAQIGTLASILGVKRTVELTGKNESQVSNYSRGKNGVGKPDPELASALEDSKGKIQEKVLSKADLFLDMLDIGKDSRENVLNATIAEKVVNIYEKLAPKNQLPNINQANIILYAPKQLETHDYPVLEVEAQNG
jgi:hypothetical protein